MLTKTALRGSFSGIVKTLWTFVSSSIHQDISTMNGFFNWTMTYRRDSDFYRPYGRIVKVRDHPEGRELEEYIRRFGRENKHLARGKSKQAAWFVSHCATQVRLHLSSGNCVWFWFCRHGNKDKRITCSVWQLPSLNSLPY